MILEKFRYLLSAISAWIKRRQQLRALWRSDARILIERDEESAYYIAQRLAARSRAQKDAKAFLHWSKVAAEVARQSAITEMDFEVVKAIVNEELSRVLPNASDPK